MVPSLLTSGYTLAALLLTHNQVYPVTTRLTHNQVYPVTTRLATY